MSVLHLIAAMPQLPYFRQNLLIKQWTLAFSRRGIGIAFVTIE